MLRLGVVESILTPESVSPRYRPNSYTGETSNTTNNERHQPDQPASSSSPGTSGETCPRVFSDGLLQPLPSASDADIARSSFMTTSTASRMSGLSDFPAPPKDHHHMSLSAYLNESLGRSEARPEHQLFFGRDQDAGDLVKTLSSSS